MKKKLLTAFLTSAVISSSALANEGNFSLALDGYDFATNVYSIQAEWFKSDDFSILFKPYTLSRSKSGIKWSGYGIELSGRTYSENNIFLQYGLDLGTVKAKVSNSSDSSFFLGFNTKAGYRYYIANTLFIDLGVGIGYYTTNVQYRSENYRDLDGVELFGIASLGYNF